MERILSALLIIGFLGSCAVSKEKKEVQSADKKRENFESQLRLGLSREEIEKISGPLVNCSGSPKGLQLCEQHFRQNSKDPSWKDEIALRAEKSLEPRPGKTGSASSSMAFLDEKATQVELVFEKNKLKRWKRK